jgi:hypothetical protein
MLYFITAWTLLLIVFGIIGMGVLNRLNPDSFDRLGDRLIASLWLGLIVFAVSLLTVGLLIPLSPGVGAATAFALVSLALVLPSVRLELRNLWAQRSRQFILCFLGLAVTIAALTSRQVIFIDTGLYHYGVIQWLSQFGTVPGIALLIPNLGFTSSWFALAAPLNPEILNGRASAVMNGLLVFLSALSFLIVFAHSVKAQARLSDWFLTGFLFFAELVILVSPQLGAIQVSTSPDLAIAFLIGITVWSILVTAQASTPNSAPSKPTTRLVPLMLALGAVTIKLTALPLLVVTSLFFLVERQFTLRRVVLGGTIAILFFTPLALSGIITSGCPLFPSTAFCLNLPWSPGMTAVQKTAAATHSWTSWYPAAAPAGVPPTLWFLWQWLNSARLSQIMAGLILLSSVCSLLLLKLRSLRDNSERFWVIAIGVLGITFLMLTTPFFRFGLSYFILIPIFTLTLYGFNSRQKTTGFSLAIARFDFNRLLNFVPIVALGATALIFAARLGIHSPFQLLIPPLMQTVPVSQVQVNNVTLAATPTKSDYCWATSLPCTSLLKQVIAQNVSLRDPAQGIRGGFVRKP